MAITLLFNRTVEQRIEVNYDLLPSDDGDARRIEIDAYIEGSLVGESLAGVDDLMRNLTHMISDKYCHERQRWIREMSITMKLVKSEGGVLALNPEEAST